MALIEIKCCRCGELFGLHETTLAGLRRSAQSFHCPWGHSQHYPLGPSDEDKLRLERDRLKQQIAERDDEIARQSAWRREAEEATRAAEARANGYKGQAAKLKKRTGNGVCPCCSRSFENLRRHMTSKHPSFALDDAPAAPVRSEVSGG